MTTIKDVRTTIWQWVGAVKPLPPNSCTTPSDLVAGESSDFAPFSFRGWLIVEIECADGSVGIGNAALAVHATKVVIDTYLKPLLINRDPLDSEQLWQSMYRHTMAFGRRGIGMAAISAVDLAIWDLKGKLTGQPVFRLLGGRTKRALPVYASKLYSQPPHELASEAQGYLQQGFKMMKLRLGWGPRDGREGMRRNLELVRTLRETVGDTVDIMADAYMGWDLEYAKRMLPKLAPYDLRWLEEPLPPDDVAGYAQLKAMGHVPISGGEHESSLAGFRQLIDACAIDFAQFDTNRVGGITVAHKITALCEAQDITVVPHAGQLHNYHIVMSSYGAPFAEYFPNGPVEVGNELFWYIFEGEPIASDGCIELREDLPGLGLTLKSPKSTEFRLVL
jgi:L-alanine-DL-glutamate epimerase-like enolase superfamily enzyme